MHEKIPVSGPSISDDEVKLVTQAVQSAWYENAGTFIKQFEQEFAKFCNRKFAISLPSCTSGLHLALASLKIKEGDEVIVPDISWIASSAPISYVNATPVFCDIEESNLCMSYQSILERITPKTKAIIAVNLYGAMPDYDKLEKLCKEKSIALIEDAAESIGSRYKNRPSGNFGDFSAFSFHGSKTLTTGEGGMLLTDSQDLYQRCLILRDHGRIPGDTLFQNKEVGFKYKMSDLQAALGLAQLRRINFLVEKKRTIQREYFNNLSSIPTLNVNFETLDVFNSYWMTSILWSDPEIDKFQVIKYFSENGIDTRPIFSPLSSLQAYSRLDLDYAQLNPVSYKVGMRGINLPSALNLSSSQIQRVCDKVLQYFSKP